MHTIRSDSHLRLLLNIRMGGGTFLECIRVQLGIILLLLESVHDPVWPCSSHVAIFLDHVRSIQAASKSLK